MSDVTRSTSRVRGPWTPSTRFSSISEVAEGPEMNVIGRAVSPAAVCRLATFTGSGHSRGQALIHGVIIHGVTSFTGSSPAHRIHGVSRIHGVKPCFRFTHSRGQAFTGSSPVSEAFTGSSPVSGLRGRFAGSEGAPRRLRGLKRFFRWLILRFGGLFQMHERRA